MFYFISISLFTSLYLSLCRSPEFGDMIEEILLNTLQNLMTEAYLGELVLTARPRVIALPPCSSRSPNFSYSLNANLFSYCLETNHQSEYTVFSVLRMSLCSYTGKTPGDCPETIWCVRVEQIDSTPWGLVPTCLA